MGKLKEKQRKKFRKSSKLFAKAKRLAKRKNFVFGHQARISRNTKIIKNDRRIKKEEEKSLDHIVFKIKCNQIRDFALSIKSIKRDNPFLVGKAKELSKAVNMDVKIILELFE